MERLTAELVVGGSAVTSAPTPISVNGRPVGTVAAGHTVTILGVQSATNQAVIVYYPAGGTKLVGLAPMDSLVGIDSAPVNTQTSAPAAPVHRTTTAPAMAPVAPAPVVTAPAAPDLNQVLDATALAKYYKADKAAAKLACEGQRIKFKGVIDHVEIDTGSSGGDMPILVLKTSSGLPRLKVRLSNTLATNDAFFRRYSSSIPDWWWGYGGNRAIDYRLIDLKEIQVRAVYRYTSTTQWSDGTSTTRRSRSNSPWFTIFKVGEPVALEGTCKGQYMDIEFDNGAVLSTNTM